MFVTPNVRAGYAEMMAVAEPADLARIRTKYAQRRVYVIVFLTVRQKVRKPLMLTSFQLHEFWVTMHFIREDLWRRWVRRLVW